MLDELEKALTKLDELPTEERLLELGELKSYISKVEKEIEDNRSKYNNSYIMFDSKTKMINEINRLIDYNYSTSELDNPSESLDYVSLIELSKYLSSISINWSNTLSRCNGIVATHADSGFDTEIIDKFDFKTGEMRLYFYTYYFSIHSSSSYYMTVNKVNGDMKIVGSGFYKERDIFNNLSGYLPKMHDDLMSFKDYFVGVEKKYKCANTDFMISLSHYDRKYSIDLISDSGENITSLGCSSGTFKTQYNSSQVNEVIKDHEKELFSNIYVRVCDLPFIFQDGIRDMKQKELESKKHKIKTLFNKIFG